MVSANGLKWAAGVLGLSVACCSVGVGLPMWVQGSYSTSSVNIYAQQGLWQACSSVSGSTLTCSAYTPSTTVVTVAVYLATAGAGCLMLAEIMLITYTCQCASAIGLLVVVLLLILIGVGCGGAGTGLFYTNVLSSPLTIAAGGMVEMAGLGVGLFALIMVLASISQKTVKPNVKPKTERPPPYVRNERRVQPQQQRRPEQTVPRNDPRDEAGHYLERYSQYRNMYNQYTGSGERDLVGEQRFDRRNLVNQM